MENLKLIIKVFLILGLGLTLTACPSKKKSSQPSFRDRSGRTINPTGGPVQPGGSPFYPSSNCPECGFVYTNGQDMKASVADFLGFDRNTLDLGFVSGQPYDTTGVVVRGYVDDYGSSGDLSIYIFDSITNATGELFQVDFQLQRAQSTQAGLEFVFADAYGTVSLVGDCTQRNTFEGTMVYTNAGRQQQSLGHFIFGGNDFFRCY